MKLREIMVSRALAQVCPILSHTFASLGNNNAYSIAYGI